MPALTNKTKKNTLAQEVILANNFWSRAKGLLGLKTLDNRSTLWISDCNSIHTFFMKFSIDLVFVDRDLKVCAVHRNVRPWRFRGPVWKAKSVFEFSTGAVPENFVEPGDQLHVGH